MPLFNFALNPGGYLFLGKSEGISGRNDLFDMVSKKARLYRRLAPARPIALDSPIFPGRRRTISTGTPAVLRPPAAGLYGRDPAGPFEPLFRQRRVGGPERTDSSVPRSNRQVPQHADGRAQPEPAGNSQAGAVAETSVGNAPGDRGRQDGRAGERSGHAGGRQLLRSRHRRPRWRSEAKRSHCWP